MAKPSPAKPSASGDQNLLWALMALIVCSFVGSVGIYLLAEYVLSSFQSSQAMAMILGDAGRIVSDDKNLEHNLSTATMGLKACRDLGLALAVGSFACAVAVSIRLFRARAS
jgi:hypothetical protein